MDTRGGRDIKARLAGFFIIRTCLRVFSGLAGKTFCHKPINLLCLFLNPKETKGELRAQIQRLQSPSILFYFPLPSAEPLPVAF